jgi:hypothetical protein
MSDMANNDLEKYGKALDKYGLFPSPVKNADHQRATYSAIMKYHSLKMEEVNDTMHHLWNKTYQGTGTHNSLHGLYNLSRQFLKTLMEFGSVMTAKAASPSDHITTEYVFFTTARRTRRSNADEH